ncbi:MAG TPA: hypothetical protein VJI68_00210 [Candidatus Nanoarchaeia archaeon]|nr:hypothetical protein [Candidatus Nanoarchaeia archaeon]
MKLKWCYLVIVLLLILTACSSISDRIPFLGGKQAPVGGSGLTLTFVNVPANNELIYEGAEFDVEVALENNIVNEQGLTGRICLQDDLTDNFGGITSNLCQNFNLPSATKSSNGKVTSVQENFLFKPQPYKGLQKELELSNSINAVVAYELESISGSEVCIKRREAEVANCLNQQKLETRQSDLPLKIQSIEAKVSSKDQSEYVVILDISLEKATKGQLLTPGSITSGSIEAPTAEVNFEISIDGKPIKCNTASAGKVTFRSNENEKLIKCTGPITLNQDSIMAQITMKMSYGFKQTLNGPKIRLIKNEELIT